MIQGVASIVLAVSLTLSVGAFAQDDGPVLTLEEAITIALIDNPSVDNASLDIDKSGTDIDVARADYFPQLNATVKSTRNFITQSYTYQQGSLGNFPATGPIPAETTEINSSSGWANTVGLTVTQSLTGIYAVTLQVEALSIQERIAAEQLRLELQDTAQQVKQLYYQILASESALKDSQSSIALYESLVGQLGNEVAQKTALEYQLLDSQAELAQSRMQALEQVNDIATQKEQLNNLMGRDTQEPFRVTGAFVPPVVDVDGETARAVALAQRPEMRQAELNIALAEKQIAIEEYDYVPDIDLMLDYSHNNYDLLPNESLYVGVVLSWEFYDWGRRSSTIAGDRISVRQAMNDLASTRASVIADVNSSLRDIENALAAVAAARMSQKAGQEKLRVTQNRYNEQVALLSDLFDAEHDLFDANNNYIDAVLDAHEAQAALSSAMGEQ